LDLFVDVVECMVQAITGRSACGSIKFYSLRNQPSGRISKWSGTAADYRLATDYKKTARE
jgi:hypothetical protein